MSKTPDFNDNDNDNDNNNIGRGNRITMAVSRGFLKISNQLINYFKNKTMAGQTSMIYMPLKRTKKVGGLVDLVEESHKSSTLFKLFSVQNFL